jgi:3',5'-nucleoside bisphosphate phosphatase
MNDQPDRLVDLHAHCSASPGAIGTPTAMAEFFRREGYAAFALTDHNALTAVDDASEAATREGVEFVPGVEMSARCDEPELGERIVHILGYLFERTPELEAMSRRHVDQSRRKWRTLLEALRERGIADIGEAELVAHIRERFGAEDAWKHPCSPGPIGDLLRARGVVSGRTNDAVRRLAEEMVPQPDSEGLSDVAEVCDVFRRAGAAVILAHPGGGKDPSDDEARRLERWLDEYVDGLEVFTPKHRPAYREMQMDLLTRKRRPFTGGSDRHDYPATGTGSKTSDAPYRCLDSLRKFLGRQSAGV